MGTFTTGNGLTIHTGDTDLRTLQVGLFQAFREGLPGVWISAGNVGASGGSIWVSANSPMQCVFDDADAMNNDVDPKVVEQFVTLASRGHISFAGIGDAQIIQTD